LLMLAVSMPTRHDIHHTVGWSAVDRMGAAILDGARKKYSAQFPQEIDECRPPEIEAITEPMNIMSLQGSTVASMIFVMVGWGLMSVGKVRRWYLLRQLAKSKGHTLTAEEIAAFEEEERRKLLLDGDMTDKCTLCVEECEKLVKNAKEGRDNKMDALDKTISEVLVKMESTYNIKVAPVVDTSVSDATALGVSGVSGIPSSATPVADKKNGATSPFPADVEKELKQEQTISEKLWREVAAERTRLKQEWIDFETARQKHAELVQSEHTERLNTFKKKANPVIIPVEMASDDPIALAKKALREKRQESQVRMNQQMEDSWVDVTAQRAAHREEVKLLSELQAETTAMWKKISKSQEESSQLRLLVPLAQSAPPGEV